MHYLDTLDAAEGRAEAAVRRRDADLAGCTELVAELRAELNDARRKHDAARRLAGELMTETVALRRELTLSDKRIAYLEGLRP